MAWTSVGTIQGPKGDTGEKGADGKGIASMQLVNGELVVSYTDGTTENLGSVSSDSIDSMQMLKFTILSDGTVSVAVKDDYRESVESIKIPATYNGPAHPSDLCSSHRE